MWGPIRYLAYQAEGSGEGREKRKGESWDVMKLGVGAAATRSWKAGRNFANYVSDVKRLVQGIVWLLFLVLWQLHLHSHKRCVNFQFSYLSVNVERCVKCLWVW